MGAIAIASGWVTFRGMAFGAGSGALPCIPPQPCQLWLCEVGGRAQPGGVQEHVGTANAAYGAQ